MNKDTGRLIAALPGKCPSCGAKASIIRDPEDKDITHIFFEHESWCNVCPPDAGLPESH